MEALPFRAGTFGTVTCRIAAHHFPALLPALREVARVLRAGGSFLVQDILGHEDAEAAAFITEVERRRDPSHVRAFRQLEWTAFLRAAGLTVMDEAVMSKRRSWDDWTTPHADDGRRPGPTWSASCWPRPPGAGRPSTSRSSTTASSRSATGCCSCAPTGTSRQGAASHLGARPS